MYKLLCVSFLLLGVSNGQYFRAQGPEILDPNGNVFLAKGLALSGLLNVEAFTLRFNAVHDKHLNGQTSIEENVERLLGSIEDASEFWSTFRDNFMSDDDVADLVGMGFNSFRLPFNYRLLSPSDGVYKEEGFALVDRVIGWCKEHNLGLILDMHATPGGQSHVQYADPEYTYWYTDAATGEYKERGVAVLWEDNAEYTAKTGKTAQDNKNHMASIWREIATRYQNEPAILAYELMNQPYFYESAGVSLDDMRDLYINVTAAIREVDNNHIIIAEGTQFAERIDGLLPVWDNNMAIAFHRYWRTSDFSDGMMQTYLDARDTHQVPLIMTESGENSNTWIYEVARLLDENGIGYFFWGWKKVDSISTAYDVAITPDYQYVIDNWRGTDAADLDSRRIRKGLMEMADGLRTENCRSLPGFLPSIIDPGFGATSKAFSDEIKIPGFIHAIHYDIGVNGVAYSDTRYKKDDSDVGRPYNSGWIYRNDGVDIRPTQNDNFSIGHHVSDTESGEWLQYTADVANQGTYQLLLHTFASKGSSGRILLSVSGEDLTGEINLPNNGNWETFVAGNKFTLKKGENKLFLRVLEGGFDLAWMQFVETTPDPIAAVDVLITDSSGGAVNSNEEEPVASAEDETAGATDLQGDGTGATTADDATGATMCSDSAARTAFGFSVVLAPILASLISLIR